MQGFSGTAETTAVGSTSVGTPVGNTTPMGEVTAAAGVVVDAVVGVVTVVKEEVVVGAAELVVGAGASVSGGEAPKATLGPGITYDEKPT